MNSTSKTYSFLFCLLIVAGSQHVYSQPDMHSEGTLPQAENPRDDLLKLPPLTNISSVSWSGSIYRFTAFQKGKITYATRVLEHEFDMNYNLYFEKVDFISSTGDTLNITNTREIKTIQIGETWFFHDYKTGYYEVILKLPVALAVKDQFIFQNRYVRGAVQFTDVRGTTADHDRYYKIVPKYFFIDEKNKLHAATKKSTLKLFAARKTEVSSFLREHNTNFQSRNELVDLITYCNQLVFTK